MDERRAAQDRGEIQLNHSSGGTSLPSLHWPPFRMCVGASRTTAAAHSCMTERPTTLHHVYVRGSRREHTRSTGFACPITLSTLAHAETHGIEKQNNERKKEAQREHAQTRSHPSTQSPLTRLNVSSPTRTHFLSQDARRGSSSGAGSTPGGRNWRDRNEDEKGANCHNKTGKEAEEHLWRFSGG